MTSSGSTITKPSSTARGSASATGDGRLTPGEARGDPLGTGLLPLGLGFLRVVVGRDVIDHPGQGLGVGDGGAERGQLVLGCAIQDGAGTLALRGDQLLAFLMDDVDDRAAPQQVLVPGVLADVGAAHAGGSIAQLITDRIAEIPGDVRVGGTCPRRSPRGSPSSRRACGRSATAATVTSPKVVLKVKGRVPRRRMPAPAFAVAVAGGPVPGRPSR